MNRTGRITRVTLASIAMVVMMAATVHAKTIQMTIITGHPPVIPWVKMLDEYFVPEVNKRLLAAGGSYEINWKKGYGGTIAKIGTELEAIEHGVVDMGIVGAVFEPANLPLQIVSYYTPFATGSIAAAVEVIDEMHSKVPAMMKAWDSFNQVYLTGIGVDDFNLFTKKPIKSLKELKGLKIGGAGPNLNWLRGLEVAGVQIDLTTIYNDLSVGIYHGVLLFPSSGSSIKVHEVAPHYLKIGFGAMSWAAITVNKKRWAALPKEVQDVFRSVARDYRDKLNVFQEDLGKKGLEMMKANGLTIAEFPADERVAWAQSLPNIAAEWAKPLEAKGLPAKEVIRLWIEGVRAKGSKPLRDWSMGL